MLAKMLKRNRIWIVGMLLVVGIIMFNVPISPKNGEIIMENNVVFKWIGYGNYAFVDDNEKFTSPLKIGKNKYVELEPGVYYWRISGLSLVSSFELKSHLGVDVKEKDVENTGNIDAGVDVKKSGIITGSFVLEKGEKKEIESLGEEEMEVAASIYE